MTHNQGGFKDHVQGWGEVPLQSLDLTSATDRFPIDFIGDVFEPLLGKQYISNWKVMLTGIPFTYKSSKGDVEVNFSVGTPLGFYGSWGPFALTVIFCQWWIRRRLLLAKGIEPTRQERLAGKFAVLGDDYLAGDEELAKEYQSLLVNQLGVQVSEKKTFRALRLCEFAKRLLFRTVSGRYVEISPFPVSAIWNTEASAPLLISTLHGEGKKDLIARSGIPGAIENLDQRLFPFYGPAFGISPKRARIRKRAARHADAVMRVVQGTMLAEDCITTILDGLTPKDYKPTSEEALNLLRRACALLYRRSMAAADRPQASAHFALELVGLILKPFDRATPTEDFPSSPPLNDLMPDTPGVDIVVRLGDLSSARRALDSVPLLSIYSRLESGMAKDLATLGDGTGPLENWPEFVRAVQLGVTGLDPRMPEEMKRVVSCSLLAKAVTDLYQGKVLDPPETEGEEFDPWGFLLRSKIPMPFTELRLLAGLKLSGDAEMVISPGRGMFLHFGELQKHIGL